MKTRFALLNLALVAWCHADSISFNRDIRPILSNNCYGCHGFDANHRAADLRLDQREAAIAVVDGVAALVPGDPAKSSAWLRIASTDPDEIMPPPESHKQLSADEKDLIKRWIAEGAEYEPHWAFVAPKRPVPPETEKQLSPIDAFIHQRLEKEGIEPLPRASKAAQLRRATFDLTGLPPTLEALDAFENDPSPDAYEKAIDRLMETRAHAEHLAMAWLDAARYADTNGFQMDALRMNFPWRDWVIRAYQNNMPFDQFSIEQLAGDLLPNPTTDQLIATAFNRNHPLNAEGGSIPEENRAKNVFDRTETTGTVWLGLTMNCSQCHDHKFDPITQRDYYSMSALFNQISEPGGVDKRFGKKEYSDDYDSLYMVESPYITLPTPDSTAALAKAAEDRKQADAEFIRISEAFKPAFVQWIAEMKADRTLLEQRVPDPEIGRGLEKVNTDNFDDFNTRRFFYFYLENVETRWLGDLKKRDDVRRQHELAMQEIPHVMVMRDDKQRDTHILLRGSYETPGEKVEPATPGFLPPLPDGEKTNRLSFARWLFTPEQPLTARVTMNRLWQQFFSKGIVKTPDDFGLQGELPVHPELLDWLAVEFRESGWDKRHMIRLIVTSEAYRRESVSSESLNSRDPENSLHARGPRFRLDSRVLRDQALALSGLLVESTGGPAVQPYQPPGIWEEMSFGKNRYFQDHGDKLYRRSLYTFWRRSVAPTHFFDVPARQVCGVKINRTSTPLHALITLNDVTYVEAARVLASRLADEPDETKRITRLFRAATSRSPESLELAALQRALDNARTHYSASPQDAEKIITAGEAPLESAGLTAIDHAAWTTLCLTVLNLDETLTQ